MRPQNWNEIIDDASSDNLKLLKSALDAARIRLIDDLGKLGLPSPKGHVQDALVNAAAKGFLSPQEVQEVRRAIDYRNTICYDDNTDPERTSTLRAVNAIKSACESLARPKPGPVESANPPSITHLPPKEPEGRTTAISGAASSPPATLGGEALLVEAAIDLFKAVGSKLPELGKKLGQYDHKLREHDAALSQKLRERLALQEERIALQYYARQRGVELGDVRKAYMRMTGRPIQESDLDTAAIDMIVARMPELVRKQETHAPKTTQQGWLSRLLGRKS
jgi:hypothetical protein